MSLVSVCPEEYSHINFATCAAEDAAFPAQFFDIISCGQSWLYSDTQWLIPLVTTWLKPGDKLVLTYLSRLPRKDPIAQASEQLILRYNPHWSEADLPGSLTSNIPGPHAIFAWSLVMLMRKGIPFTRESWRGRIRACRGIGASLVPEEGARFDQEHNGLLRQIAPDTFAIPPQVWLHAYTPIGDVDVVQASLS